MAVDRFGEPVIVTADGRARVYPTHPGFLHIYPRLTTMRYKGKKLPFFELEVRREDGNWRVDSLKKLHEEECWPDEMPDLLVKNVLELLPTWCDENLRISARSLCKV
jgi:hypothetical protein